MSKGVEEVNLHSKFSWQTHTVTLVPITNELVCMTKLSKITLTSTSEFKGLEFANSALLTGILSDGKSLDNVDESKDGE